VQAGLAALAAALVGGAIVTQYVDDHIFCLVVPGLFGLATAAVATGAGEGRHAVPTAVCAALLGTALGFRLTPGGQSVLHPWHEVGPPYLCAALGALLWRVGFSPTGRRADR
jgi:hypothetical protein